MYFKSRFFVLLIVPFFISCIAKTTFVEEEYKKDIYHNVLIVGDFMPDDENHKIVLQVFKKYFIENAEEFETNFYFYELDKLKAFGKKNEQDLKAIDKEVNDKNIDLLVDFKYTTFKSNNVTLGEESTYFNSSMSATDVDSQKKVIAILKAFEDKPKKINKGAKHFLEKLYKRNFIQKINP